MIGLGHGRLARLIVRLSRILPGAIMYVPLFSSLQFSKLLVCIMHFPPIIIAPLPLVPRLIHLMPEVNSAAEVALCDLVHTLDVRYGPGLSDGR